MQPPTPHSPRLRWTLALLALGLVACGRKPELQANDPLAFLSRGEAGYARALEPIALNFPRDHGAHEDFESEWWYVTGQLVDQGDPGARFGLQFTLFRQALVPPAERQTGRRSKLASSQAYVSHVALGDVQRRRLLAFARTSRGAEGLAGATAEPCLAFLGPNSLKGVRGLGDGELPTFLLELDEPGLSVRLELVSEKPLVLHGQEGLSQKGDLAGNASYYFSATRLRATGQIDLDGQRHLVSGACWLDREWSSSVLEPEQRGWNWVSFQLDDGRDLMAFELLRADGRRDPHSSGSLVAADGSVQHLSSTDFSLESLQTWTSPRTGREFGTRWRIQVPGAGLELLAEALFPDQELDLALSYYEGAFDARTAGRTGPSGHGFIEQVRGGPRAASD